MRRLEFSDLPAAMKLKDTAGWNQTEADWRRLLKLEPEGCFAAIENDQLVGTTTTTRYGDELAWIGMVLVDPQHRRCGIATRLMEMALAYLDGRVVTVKLDATADGRPVYERFGFETESLIERWRGTVTTRSVEQEQETFDLDALLALDRRAFNADRSRLISYLIDDAPVAPVSLQDESGLTGYALTRAGTRAVYLGPVVTTDHAHVESLLDRTLAQLNTSSVYVDFNTECGMNSSVLAARGFVKERDLIRMTRGSRSAKTSPLVIAIAGPEVG